MLTDNKIVRIDNLNFKNRFDHNIFYGAEFVLNSGQTAIIEGSTGTGKSSLVELLIGRKFPEIGQIEVLGKIIKKGNERKLKQIRQKIGGVGGIFQPISYETVYNNMGLPLILRNMNKAERKTRILNGIARFNLLSKKGEKAAYLSQGEKNLLMLARAVVGDQPLLLIDEPLAGLDTKMSDEVRKMLNRLAIAGHAMIILTSSEANLGIQSAIKYEIKSGKIV